MSNIKERARKERYEDGDTWHPTAEVPEYAHELEEPFSVTVPDGVRTFLQAYFRAGWDDMPGDAEAYWLGEGIRCFQRNKTVWRIKTVEEATDILWRIEHYATSTPHGLVGWGRQQKQACQRILSELRENLDREELEQKLENTEYADILEKLDNGGQDE